MMVFAMVENRRHLLGGEERGGSSVSTFATGSSGRRSRSSDSPMQKCAIGKDHHNPIKPHSVSHTFFSNSFSLSLSLLVII